MSQPITTAGTCRVAVEERPRCQRIARNEPSVLQGDEEHVGAWKRLNHVVGGGLRIDPNTGEGRVYNYVSWDLAQPWDMLIYY